MPDRIVNPDFRVDDERARAEIERMRASPRPLERPVLVLAGWRSPRLWIKGVASMLAPITSGRAEDFRSIGYPELGDVEGPARRVLNLARAWRSGPYDVVGVSMGGLVARLLALPPERSGLPGRLDVARLFTLATPHRGARLARWFRPDRAAAAMRPGSELLRRLDDALPGLNYELICYGHLRDWWVGGRGTAPPGREPIWIDTRGPAESIFSHFTINRDARVLVDIARRLRGESPLGREGGPPPID